jgi:mRNA-degrading endonuclease RelE of RelBE toxin-antitoxin system
MSLPTVVKKAVQLITVDAEKAYSNDEYDEWSYIRDEAKELLKSNGYTYEGSGDYRMVYSYPNKNKVVKIPKLPIGQKENQSECENWDNAPSDIKNQLAEIYDADWNGKWLIQEYIPIESCSKSEAKKLSNKLKNNNVYIAEIDVWNVGKRNDGTVVAFDYAGNY